MENNKLSALKEKIRDFLSRMLALALAVLTLGSVFIGVFEPMVAVAEGEEPDNSSWPTDSLADWMEYLPDYYPITQLNFPGTHDSTAVEVAWSAWSVCQKFYIDELLDRGIRVFDIRLHFKHNDGSSRDENGPLMGTHNGYTCWYNRGDIRDVYKYEDYVLEPCIKFVKDHPSETVVIRAVRESSRTWKMSDNDKQVITQKIQKANQNIALKYPDNVLLPKPGSEVPPLGSARGKVIILKDIDDGQEKMETKYEDHCDTISIGEKINYLKQCFNNSASMNAAAEDKFIKQGEYTDQRKIGEPYVKQVMSNFNSVGDCGPTSPSVHDYAVRINTEMYKYSFQRGKRYGWINMDFPTYYKDDKEGEIHDGKELIWKIIKTNPVSNCTWCYTEGNVLHFYSGFIKEEELRSRLKGKNIIAYGSFDDTLPMAENSVPWKEYRTSATKVVIEDEIHPKYLNHWFNGFYNCTDFQLTKLKTDKTEGYSYLFANCTAVRILDLRSFSGAVNNKVRVDRMFYNDSELRTIFVENLDFSELNVAGNYPYMFEGDKNLVGGLGTKCSGTLSRDDFRFARADQNSPERKEGYFTKYVENPPIFWQISDGTLSISSQKPDPSWTQFNWKGLSSGISVPNWWDRRNDIKKVTVTDPVYPSDLSYWFLGFTNAEYFELENLVLLNCAGMHGMFKDCTKVQELYLADWAKSLPCDYMFENCSALKTIYVDPGFSMTDQHDTYGRNMFDSCTNLVGQNGTTYSDKQVKDASYALIDEEGSPGYFTEAAKMFWGYSTSTLTLYISGERNQFAYTPFADIVYDSNETVPWAVVIARAWGNIEHIDVMTPIKPKHMSNWFRRINTLRSVSLKNIDTSQTEDMDYLFEGTFGCQELDLSTWKSDSVKSANGMFANMYRKTQYFLSGVKTIYTSMDFDLTGNGKESFTAEKMFENDANLSGGFGTVLENLEGAPDKTFARVDLQGRRGLFTNGSGTRMFYYGVDEETNTLYLSDTISDQTPNSFEDKRREQGRSPFESVLGGVESVVVLNEMQPYYTDHWFDTSDFAVPPEISFDLKLLDTSKTVDMSYMFAGLNVTSEKCSVLDLSSFTGESVQYAKGMFKNSGFKRILVSEEKDLDLTHLSAENCAEMFYGCRNIVGGAATVYDETKTDNQWARYDTKNDEPGYFTIPANLYYTVDFLNWDGSLLQSGNFLFKSIPKYTGPTPVKLEDREYEYTFSGWTEELAPVTTDTSYYAKYEPFPISYQFTEGMGKHYRRGSLQTWNFSVNGPIEGLFAIAVDEGQLEEENGLLADGGNSVNFMLKPAYLDTLSVGEHTVTAFFRNGSWPKASFTIEEALGVVEFYKRDKDTGSLLGGAELKVYKVSDDTFNIPVVAESEIENYIEEHSLVPIDEWTSSNLEAHSISLESGDKVLGNGVYFLIETSAPLGYEKADHITFVIMGPNVYIWQKGHLEFKEKNDIVMLDKELVNPDVSVTFVKKEKNVDGNHTIGGAKIVIEGLDLIYTRDWTTVEDENLELKLHPGHYLMFEEEAPRGYYPAESVEFLVETPHMQDDEIAPGDVVQVKREAGCTLQQLIIPDAYVVMEDVRKKTVAVEFCKKDEEDHFVSGAVLKVTGIDTNFSESWTTGAEAHELNLWPGTYDLIETEAPRGYYKAASIRFMVKEDPASDKMSVVLVGTNDAGAKTEEPLPADPPVITMTDKARPPMNVSVSIVDDAGSLIGGAGLKITGEDNNYSYEWNSEAGRIEKLDLHPGTYLMEETEVPAGYLPAENIRFRVKEDPETGILSLFRIEKDESGEEKELPVLSIVMKSRAKVQYKIIEGADSTYTLGSNKTHHFRSNAPYAKFTSVEIDGKTVDPANYTVSEGSTNADFKGSYMETLSVGTHSITMLASDGSASANFKVVKKPDPTPTPVPTSNPKKGPQTGDSSNVAPWLSLMLFSAAAVFLTMSKTKKFGILLKRIFRA